MIGWAYQAQHYTGFLLISMAEVSPSEVKFSVLETSCLIRLHCLVVAYRALGPLLLSLYLLPRGTDHNLSFAVSADGILFSFKPSETFRLI